MRIGKQMFSALISALILAMAIPGCANTPQNNQPTETGPKNTEKPVENGEDIEGDMTSFEIGAFINATATSQPESKEYSGANASNNSGMSGSDSPLQTHQAGSSGKSTMWLAAQGSDNSPWIQFDFSRVEQLGAMVIWNFNEEGRASAGIKEVRIFSSTDGTQWTELKGDNYPYVFKQAKGEAGQKATNLEGGMPVDFKGAAARYVKLVPVSNWRDTGKGFGLSEVRFYRYKEPAAKGSYITLEPYKRGPAKDDPMVYSMVNSDGMSGPSSKQDTHGNKPETMWLSKADASFASGVVFDLGGSYPLDEMWVWNYNEQGAADAGMKKVRIFYTDNPVVAWTELKGEGYPYTLAKASGEEGLKATNLDDGKQSPIKFGNVQAQFIKIVPDNDEGTWGSYKDGTRRFGLSEARIYTGSGYCVEPARDWTGLFSNYNGWSGADGIYSVSLDAYDAVGAEEHKPARTLFVFSDTFVGNVNPITHSRASAGLINNSYAIMEGYDPASARLSFMTQSKAVPLKPQGVEGYYWQGDTFVANGNAYVFPLHIQTDPSAPAGFNFKQVGVHMARFPIVGGNVDFDTVNVTDIQLGKREGKVSWLFGGSAMPNTKEAGAPNPDGYLYVYGYKDDSTGRHLIVSRVKPENVETRSEWRFWGGGSWVEDMTLSASIADNVSPEMSMMPVTDGEFSGKYRMVYTAGTMGSFVNSRIGDSPVGPFGKEEKLYFIPETDDLDAKGVFMYNAKAHPHLSRKGELIISYNMNTVNMSANYSNADVYRPRFIRYKAIPAK